jgi:hypothetical protein
MDGVQVRGVRGSHIVLWQPGDGRDAPDVVPGKAPGNLQDAACLQPGERGSDRAAAEPGVLPDGLVAGATETVALVEEAVDQHPEDHQADHGHDAVAPAEFLRAALQGLGQEHNPGDGVAVQGAAVKAPVPHERRTMTISAAVTA